MSGSPTEVQIRAQWTAAIAILESVRNLADSSVAGDGNLLDDLVVSLKGEYTPSLTTVTSRMRAGLSALVSPQQAQQAFGPVLLEYGHRISKGGGYRDLLLLMGALYDHFVDNALYVLTRGIGYDLTPTLGTDNVGNGAIGRLTVDHGGFDLEACHVETKRFVCVADQNQGVKKGAEVFEFLGEASSPDNLLVGAAYDTGKLFGSGQSQSARLRSYHAGGGPGGSSLNNSSWSTYVATNSPKFTAWDETTNPTKVTQNTSVTYRSYPNATVEGSLQLTGDGGTVLITQTLANMRITRFEDRPYGLRIMAKADVGVATDGNLIVTLGSSSQSFAVNTIRTTGGWVEIILDFDADSWFQNFGEADMAVTISWDSPTSGYLLLDDAILMALDSIDGTYWWIRQNAAVPVNWLVDDELSFTDTGGAPGTGKLQWWLWRSGYGYLPNSGTTQIPEPA
jgi:hypothetical protein